MKKDISDDTIEYVGILAMLELSAEERKQAKQDMEEMLQYFDKLAEVNTDDIEPMSHVFDVHNFLREDLVTNGDNRELMLQNAPMQKDGMYQVPKTI